MAEVVVSWSNTPWKWPYAAPCFSHALGLHFRSQFVKLLPRIKDATWLSVEMRRSYAQMVKDSLSYIIFQIYLTIVLQLVHTSSLCFRVSISFPDHIIYYIIQFMEMNQDEIWVREEEEWIDLKTWTISSMYSYRNILVSDDARTTNCLQGYSLSLTIGNKFHAVISNS